MASFNKFNKFVQHLSDKLLDLDGSPPPDTLKIALTDAAPVATNDIFTDITDLAAGNGYTAGGTALTNPAGTISTATVTLAADQCVFTASGGSIAQFRYAVLYDSTATYLIGWWDYGAEVNLTVGSTFTIQFNGSASGGTIYTLA